MMTGINKEMRKLDLSFCDTISDKLTHRPRIYKRLFTTDEIIFLRDVIEEKREELLRTVEEDEAVEEFIGLRNLFGQQLPTLPMVVDNNDSGFVKKTKSRRNTQSQAT